MLPAGVCCTGSAGGGGGYTAAAGAGAWFTRGDAGGGGAWYTGGGVGAGSENTGVVVLLLLLRLVELRALEKEMMLLPGSTASAKMLGLYGGTSSVWRTECTNRDCFCWGGSSGWTSMASGIWGMLALAPFSLAFLERSLRGVGYKNYGMLILFRDMYTYMITQSISVTRNLTASTL
jgi:hypothetical protein